MRRRDRHRKRDIEKERQKERRRAEERGSGGSQEAERGPRLVLSKESEEETLLEAA